MTSEECGWRIPSAYPFFSRGVLRSLIGSRPQRIPLTHTLAPHGVGRILAIFQLHPDDERGMWLAHTQRILVFVERHFGNAKGVACPAHTPDAYPCSGVI